MRLFAISHKPRPGRPNSPRADFVVYTESEIDAAKAFGISINQLRAQTALPPQNILPITSKGEVYSIYYGAEITLFHIGRAPFG